MPQVDQVKIIETNDSITVVLAGVPRVVKRGDAIYENVKKVIAAGAWDELEDALSTTKTLEKWSKGSFKIVGDSLQWEGEDLPRGMNERIVKMIREGSDVEALLKFWELLQKNPSKRSVDQLWGFLAHGNIPIGKDGHIYAYKSVRQNYMDHQTGTFINKPGAVLTMPRNKISDDPQAACAEGFHVGSLRYARGFNSNGRLMIVRVSPEHVVSVPYDSSQEKVRVCRYEVVGHHGVDLPDALMAQEDIPQRQPGEVKEKIQREPKTPEAKVELRKANEKKIAEEEGAQHKKVKGQKKLSTVAELSIAEMRKYATHVLKIVGASKLPGGKDALLAKIADIQGAD